MCLMPSRLQGQELGDARPREDMVTSLNALPEAKAEEHRSQVMEAQRCVPSTEQQLWKPPVVPGHPSE
jgi:hypothetical protein